MRLFIAAELPSDVCDALAHTQAELRANIRGRYISPDLFHVTLAFLGNVDSYRVDSLIDVLENACSELKSFEVCLGELGHFGRAHKATLWQGFTNKTDFAELAKRIRSGLTQDGFDFDSKGFIPHVTLMRNANISEGMLPMPAIAHGTVSTVTLFKSDLSGERPIYTALHRAELIG